MTDFDPRQITQDIFRRLRRSGLVLGAGELLAALKLIDDEFVGVGDPDTLKDILSVLWCSSLTERGELEAIWEILLDFMARDEELTSQDDSSPVLPEDFPKPPIPKEPSTLKPKQDVEPAPTQAGFGTLPLQAPFVSVEMDEPHFGLDAYGPLSRRDMVYTWRHLRRPLADGPPDILDVAATITQYAQQGFFLSPVYRRRLTNQAHLVLLVDQGGSMMPFHRLTRDLVETAVSKSDLKRIDVYYFQNVPGKNVYTDQRRTQATLLNHVLASCDSDTSIMIVSDAGAARGYRRRERIRPTASFLHKLKRHTSLLAWLNPMPAHRWPGTSAQIIAHMVAMSQLDTDGFNNAIDTARGQVFGAAGR